MKTFWKYLVPYFTFVNFTFKFINKYDLYSFGFNISRKKFWMNEWNNWPEKKSLNLKLELSQFCFYNFWSLYFKTCLNSKKLFIRFGIWCPLWLRIGFDSRPKPTFNHIFCLDKLVLWKSIESRFVEFPILPKIHSVESPFLPKICSVESKFLPKIRSVELMIHRSTLLT